MDNEKPLCSDTTVPSSPSAAIFSDEVGCASSPPSSPPGFLWEQQKDANEPLQKPIKSAFSILGKRKALESISDNVRSAKKTAIATTKPAQSTLTQMQISLGQEVQKKCKICGMEYVPSSEEDRKLHEKYHKQNTEGYDVGKDFVSRSRVMSVSKAGANDADSICALDCFDKPARKRRGQAVLEIVQRELGAVEIPERTIWDDKDIDGLRIREPEFRAYLYIRGTKCVGFLLTQKINEAHAVLEPSLSLDESIKPRRSSSGALAALKARQSVAAEQLKLVQSQPITLSERLTPAQLGISRIWTSPTHRGQNIATTLLDTALEHQNQRLKRDKSVQAAASSEIQMRGDSKESPKQIESSMPPTERLLLKEDVAFTQPTEAGARLARKWFGKLWGWGVYVD